MKLYIIVKNYEADFDYSWDYSPYELCQAFLSEEEAEQAKKSWETENGGETWEEEDFNCYYTIAEVELESVKPVENPNLVRGGWIGREAECCGKCGTNLRFLAKFCDKCGMPVDREDLSGKIKREIRERAKI